MLHCRLEEEKVFKDPVHRYVHVKDRLIWELIDTPEFQRLRRIRQLGTTYTTFHGAEHSRFSHSLGVYEVMRRILNKFTDVTPWEEEDRLLCLCAALLHDVGHGPFSHTFEKIFDTDHEQWTQRILLGDTRINKLLLSISNEFPRKVSDVIAKRYSNKLIVSLISSQLDADRMDYLLRDAYYTGVDYGNYDIERIFRVIRPYEKYTVIKQSGMHVVEDYIMARYQMYWQVYYHPVSRSAEVILRNIFKRSKFLYEQGYVFEQEPELLDKLFRGDITLDIYMRLDESVMFYLFQVWQYSRDAILADLCQRFLNRDLFKYVEYKPDCQSELLQQLSVLMREAGIDPDYYLAIDSSSDLPYDVYHAGDETKFPIYLLMSNGQLKELSQESEIVEAISGKRRTDHKLFYALEMPQSHHEGGNREKLEEIERLLESMR